MKKILATFINELQLFRKDITGMTLLFLMPLALTIIMALIQDAPFREYQDITFDILWVDRDSGRMASKMGEGLQETGQFRLVRQINGHPLQREEALELVQAGTYKICIIIPEGTSAEVVNSANQVANEFGKTLGAAGRLPQRATRNSSIEIYFDPVTKQALKLSLLNAMDKQLTKVQAEIIMGRLSDRMKGERGDTTSITDSFNLQDKMKAVSIKEMQAVASRKVNINTNSVQHNVPAWAIFGLFFIIVPISGNMIREREEGSLTRIKLVPGSYFSILMGKVMFYVLLGVLQFYIMLLAGLSILPVLGLPSLYMGETPLLLLLATIVIALTATTYGICIGALFKTANQALPFGAISIVILSAIGGIWVPVEILPSGLQQLAKISPLYWSLDAVNSLFLRGGTFSAIFPNIAVLLSFAAFFIFLAGFVETSRKG